MQYKKICKRHWLFKLLWKIDAKFIYSILAKNLIKNQTSFYALIEKIFKKD